MMIVLTYYVAHNVMITTYLFTFVGMPYRKRSDDEDVASVVL